MHRVFIVMQLNTVARNLNSHLTEADSSRLRCARVKLDTIHPGEGKKFVGMR